MGSISGFRNFVEKYFDKLLLAGMVLYLIHVVIFLSIYSKAPETISWARELTSGFAGGLLGLITGVRVGQRMEQDRAAAEKAEDKKEEDK